MKTKRRRKPRTQRKTLERLLMNAAVILLTGAASGDVNGNDADEVESALEASELDADDKSARSSHPSPLSSAASPSLLPTMLAMDEDRRIHDSLVHALSESLEHMTSLERSDAVRTLATAQQVPMRAVAALALENSYPIIGATWCLEQLAQDPAPIVRRVVARAAKARRAESPVALDRVLRTLERDPDRSVAAAARDMPRSRYT